MMDLNFKAGSIFGLWTIQRVDEATLKKYRPNYICHCVCGVERSVSGYALMRGESKSCGCRGRKTHSVKSGQFFSKWEVISEVSPKDGKRIIRCKCNCGFISEVRLTELASGKSRSCGCSRREFWKKREGIECESSRVKKDSS